MYDLNIFYIFIMRLHCRTLWNDSIYMHSPNFNRDINDFKYNIFKVFYFQLVAQPFVHENVLMFQFPAACMYGTTSHN